MSVKYKVNYSFFSIPDNKELDRDSEVVSTLEQAEALAKIHTYIGIKYKGIAEIVEIEV